MDAVPSTLFCLTTPNSSSNRRVDSVGPLLPFLSGAQEKIYLAKYFEKHKMPEFRPKLYSNLQLYLVNISVILNHINYVLSKLEII